MTPRPTLAAHKRPSSAIFIGSGKSLSTLTGSSSSDSLNASQLPELPDPPSPSSSSGLPSPPTTNSESSNGSAGTSSQAGGSVRGHPQRISYDAEPILGASLSGGGGSVGSGTLNGSGGSGGSKGHRANGSVSSGRRSRIGSDDEDDDDNDEDNTARLANDRRRSARLSTENALSLTRARSLTERNRQILQNGVSSERKNTPSPSGAARLTRSPPTGSTSASSSSSSTASSRLSLSSRHEPAQKDRSYHSGSETEREQRDYSSDDRMTPPSAVFRAQYNTDIRSRRISAPASPAKLPARLARVDRPDSPSSSKTRRRISMLDDRDDVRNAALAAVANSRRSPTGSGKKARQPLPREFRDQSTSLDGRPVSEHLVPQRTGDRAVSPGVLSGRGSPDPSSSASTFAGGNVAPSPRPTRINRSSTVREMARRYSERHLSEDLTQLSFEEEEQPPDTPADDGRRQGARGGSADSVLALAGGGRSLVGEGLRAAGITMRQDDIFSADGAPLRRTRLSGGLGTRPTADTWSETSDTRSTTSRSTNRRSADFSNTLRTPSRRTTAAARERGMESQPRPSTAMAYTEDAPPRSAPGMVRHRTAMPMHGRDREPDRTGQSSRQQTYDNGRDRTYTSPALNRSNALTAQLTGGRKHNQNMVDSLARFELQLKRLQPMLNQGAADSVPDLTRDASTLVHSMNLLNAMLHEGVENAMSNQIAADLQDDNQSGPSEASSIWGEIGGDLRENVRVSDEMVRSTTQFILGVVDLIRGTTAPEHGRSVSLDEEAIQRQTSQSSGRHSVGSDRSAEYRHGLERRSLDQDRGPRRSLSRAESRPVSALSQIRDPTAPLSDPPQRRTPVTISAGATRRLYSPREQENMNLTPSTSERSTLAEPSPTPAARTTIIEARRRTLTPLAIPPPLPTLPSESLLRRNGSINKAPATATTTPSRRNRPSTASNATVRAPAFPLLSTPNSTTAVTPLSVSNASTAFPMTRSMSDSPNVTFSRATKDTSTAATAALNDLHTRDGRRRTISSSSALGASPVVATPISGSETERERDRPTTIAARSRPSQEYGAPTIRERTRDTISVPGPKRERRRTVTEVFTR